jgi:NADPH:quinone reductase-like Zn-dependent oxidoreductase
MPVKDDLTPLSDGAGEVVAVGENATRYKVGDRVIPTCRPGWIVGRPSDPRSIGNVDDGVLREYMIVDEQALVPMPANYTFAQASTLACAAVTAWNALFGLRRLTPGDWVLTQGTGGVSLFAIQVRLASYSADCSVRKDHGRSGRRYDVLGR